ncbi:hypothetical protein ACFO0N_20205 [Halobium salinum]|uniref:Uncharacterized protein n=1 Tax=Halobium salinum TaxID=1364940 RepID=A0ABD5PHU8_9EURY|nr:hypothetical protein [Halobium salinum]
MGDILTEAQIQLEDAYEAFENVQSVHQVVYASQDTMSALLYLQLVAAHHDEKLKADVTELSQNLISNISALTNTEIGNHGELENPTAVDDVRLTIDEARSVAWELRDYRDDPDFDLEEIRNWTTADERFQAIGRAMYRHPEITKSTLEELFRLESDLEPPFGRIQTD